MRSTNTDTDFIREIGNLSELKELSLPATADREYLYFVRSFKNLESLIMGETTLDDSDLEELVGMENLQLLVLPKTVADVGLGVIARIPTIRHIWSSSWRITKNGLWELSKIANLESLFLEVSVDHDSMSVIASFPKLRRLWLNSEAMDCSAFDALKNCASLRELRVGGPFIYDPAFWYFQYITQLENLYIRESKLSPINLYDLRATMAPCKVDHAPRTLATGGNDRFWLEQRKFERNAIHPWGRLDSMKGPVGVSPDNEFRIVGSYLNSEDFRLLPNFSEISVLEFSIRKSKVSPDDIVFITSLPELKTIELIECEISDNAFAEIGRLKELVRVVLDFSRLNEETLEPILELETLSSLSIKGCSVSEDFLAKLMEKNTSISIEQN